MLKIAKQSKNRLCGHKRRTSKMALQELAHILCAVCVILPVSLAGPLDIPGLCGMWHKPCQCGTPGYTFHLELKQCTYFYRWKNTCKPCKDIDESLLCDPYKHCLECSANVDKCVKCPATRYGRWCHHVCECQNGGSCDETGQCTCLPGYVGTKCEKVIECSQPLLSINVIIQPKALTYPAKSNVQFKCEDDFLLEGAATAQCSASGQWSIIPPICLPLCKALPVPDHGTANLPLGRIVPGTIVRFVCNQGFALSGPSYRRCQDDGSWTSSQPTCEPSIECLQPVLPENSILLESSSKRPFTPGSKIVHQCKDGFVLVGVATITCDDTGKWSQQPPGCVRAEETCPTPGPLENGKIKTVDGPDGGTVRLMGTHLQFSCDPLHFLSGSSEAFCQGNQTWSAQLPACIKVPTCSALDSLPNGEIQILKPDTRLQATRTFSRSSIGPSSNMSRRTGHGRFRSNVRTHSSAPMSLQQEGALKMDLPEGFYHVGTQANFDCESKYYALQGSRMRRCMANGQWSGRPNTCIPVCGRSSDPRTPFITHGTPSDIGQWPWIVGVSRLTVDGDYTLHCGASLIDERWVITAAHCVTYEYQSALLPVNELQFYAGKYFWNNSLDDDLVQVRKAEAIHVHPDYDPFGLDSDLAMIRLAEPVRLTSRVQPVCLPTTDPIESQERLKEGNRGVVIGWGETEDDESSDVLLHIQAPVVPTDKCVKGYKEAGVNMRITSSMFCAGYEEGKHDACSGDSGGPFVFPSDESATRYVLEGVTSWGSPDGCGLKKQYGGYVRVQRFIDWIHTFV